MIRPNSSGRRAATATLTVPGRRPAPVAGRGDGCLLTGSPQ
jgi:hypothetical protein